METQGLFGLEAGWYDYMSGGYTVYLMTGLMPENNEVIYSIDNIDGFKAMFEEQILCSKHVVLSRYADYRNTKCTLRMSGDALEFEQDIRTGDVTWAMFSLDIAGSNIVFITNKVGLWQDETAIVVLDSVSSIDKGETRTIKAITIEIQEVMPAQEASGGA